MSRRTWQRPTRRKDAAGDEPDGLAERVRQTLRRLKSELRPRPTNLAIAEYVGLPERWVQRYFAGARGERATLEELDSLCRYFNVRLGDVLIGASPDLGTDPVDARWSAIGKVLMPDERDHVEETIAYLLRARRLRGVRLGDKLPPPAPLALGPDDRRHVAAPARTRRRT